MSLFKGTLLDFQQEAIDKLANQPCVLIADEMGLGKSYEAVALDCLRRTRAGLKTLVIAPKTLHTMWMELFADLTDLDVVKTDNSTKAKRNNRWQYFVDSEADAFIINYESVRLLPQLIKQRWFHVICDEVHRIGNRNSSQTKAVKKIKKVDYKTGLSGTPGEKDNLWSILHWMYPQRYTSHSDWCDTYIKSYVPKIRNADNDIVDAPYSVIIGLRKENLPVLHAKMEPYYVRRLKQNVLKSLPSKYYTEIKVDMDPKQAREYHSMRRIMLAWVGQQEDEVLAAPVTIAKLTRLQQMADGCLEGDPDSGKWRFIKPSPKLEALMNLIDSTDQSIVVFSQFATMINFVEAELIEKGISYSKLIGAVPEAKRGNLVSDFQSGASKIFLSTIAAGGEGITLHRASTEVFLDRTWSVRMNSQAEDRCHRIGQHSAVQVIDIMATGTVDLGRKTKLETKKQWVMDILGD